MQGNTFTGSGDQDVDIFVCGDIVLLTAPSNIKVEKYVRAATWWPSWCLTHSGHWMHVFELN